MATALYTNTHSWMHSIRAILKLRGYVPVGFDVLVALKEVAPREGRVVPLVALHLTAISTAGQRGR